jgi:hypothetical protein
MEIHSTHGARFELALDRLEQGETVGFSGVGIVIRAGAVEVRVPSSWAPENANVERARHDIRLAEQALSELTTLSERFAALVSGRPTVFVLLHDYGDAGIEFCRKAGDVIEWAKGYPKK